MPQAAAADFNTDREGAALERFTGQLLFLWNLTSSLAGLNQYASVIKSHQNGCWRQSLLYA